MPGLGEKRARSAAKPLSDITLFAYQELTAHCAPHRIVVTGIQSGNYEIGMADQFATAAIYPSLHDKSRQFQTNIWDLKWVL